MTTRITLDKAAEETAMRYAKSRNISLSEAVSEIVREHGERTDLMSRFQDCSAAAPEINPYNHRIKYEDGIPTFNIPQGRIVTDAEIRAAIAEDF